VYNYIHQKAQSKEQQRFTTNFLFKYEYNKYKSYINSFSTKNNIVLTKINFKFLTKHIEQKQSAKTQLKRPLLSK